MGYILPVNNVQSQQYANRLAMEPYNFAKINRVRPIKFKTDFIDDFEETLESYQGRQYEQEKNNERRKNEQRKSEPLRTENSGYIFPNPVKLSPAISQVVGKGFSVNTYV